MVDSVSRSPQEFVGEPQITKQRETKSSALFNKEVHSLKDLSLKQQFFQGLSKLGLFKQYKWISLSKTEDGKKIYVRVDSLKKQFNQQAASTKDRLSTTDVIRLTKLAKKIMDKNEAITVRQGEKIDGIVAPRTFHVKEGKVYVASKVMLAGGRSKQIFKVWEFSVGKQESEQKTTSWIHKEGIKEEELRIEKELYGEEAFHIISHGKNTSVVEEAYDSSLENRELPFEQVLSCAKQMGAALEKLHEQPLKLCHGDVKPGNALINVSNDGSIKCKLMDFDESYPLEDLNTLRTTYYGTVDYTAPERLQGDTGYAGHDAYAFGCVLSQLLCPGEALPSADFSISDPQGYATRRQEFCDKIAERAAQEEDPKRKELLSACSMLLHTNPEARISIREFNILINQPNSEKADEIKLQHLLKILPNA